MSKELEDIVQYLTSEWKVGYKIKNISWKYPWKKISYKILNTLADKICKEAYQKQSDYNLNVLCAVQEIYKILYNKERELGIFLCEDDFDKRNNILDLLLAFKLYQQEENSEAILYLAPTEIHSEEYLNAILDEIKEMEIRNIHFLFQLSEKERQEIYKKIHMIMSFKERSVDEIKDRIMIPIKQIVFCKEVIGEISSKHIKIIDSLSDMYAILRLIKELWDVEV